MAHCGSYVFGECTYGACNESSWVPEGLGDGGDWAANAPSFGLHVTMIPTVGAIVSYCRGDGYSPFGHCGRVLQVYGDGTFLVREMNYVAWDDYDQRVSSQYDVCGFILPPGVSPGAGPPPGGGAGSAPGELLASWDRLAYYYNVESNALFLHHGDRFNAISADLGHP